jgi:hypothetical protein
VFRVLIVLVLAIAGWVSCAGTEVWTRAERVDDASLAGMWAGPDGASLMLGGNGEFHASHLPAAAFRGERVPQLDGVDARWTRERHDLVTSSPAVDSPGADRDMTAAQLRLGTPTVWGGGGCVGGLRRSAW